MGTTKRRYSKEEIVKRGEAKEISENLRYAVSVVPNVSLFEYEVEFRLKPAQGLR